MNGQRFSVVQGIAAALIHGLLTEDDGATAIEYGLMAALIAIACIAAFQATGTSLGAVFTFWSAAVVAAL